MTAEREGQQIDTLPVQLYGWDYVNDVPVKVLVNTDGETEIDNG